MYCPRVKLTLNAEGQVCGLEMESSDSGVPVNVSIETDREGTPLDFSFGTANWFSRADFAKPPAARRSPSFAEIMDLKHPGDPVKFRVQRPGKPKPSGVSRADPLPLDDLRVRLVEQGIPAEKVDDAVAAGFTRIADVDLVSKSQAPVLNPMQVVEQTMREWDAEAAEPDPAPETWRDRAPLL